MTQINTLYIGIDTYNNNIFEKYRLIYVLLYEPNDINNDLDARVVYYSRRHRAGGGSYNNIIIICSRVYRRSSRSMLSDDGSVLAKWQYV